MQSSPTISKGKLFQQLEYTPHSQGQAEIHTSTARFKVPCCGRRYGKSQAAGHEMTYWSFMPDSYFWIVGPTYALGEKEFRVVWNDYKKLGLLDRCDSQYNAKSGSMRIFTPWNTEIKVTSAERPKSLLGEGLRGVIMSEAAEHDPQTWHEFIRPALSDFHGWAMFPSTPEGFNWYYELWRRGQDSEYPEWKSWSFPSWENKARYPNGRDDPEFEEAERTTSEMWFRQEYGAEFTTFQGRIYDEFDERIHVVELEYNKEWKNYWAFDFGFSNPFVCLDIMVDPSDNVYVWREYYTRYKSTMEHGRILRERINPDGFHVDSMFGDPAGADEIATLALILGAVWGRKVGWKLGVEAVKRQLKVDSVTNRPKLFIDRSCRNLIREMNMLRMKETTQFDKNPKEMQHDYDDHAADALRYFHNEYFILGAGSSLQTAYARENPITSGSYFHYDTAGFQLGDSKWQL